MQNRDAYGVTGWFSEILTIVLGSGFEGFLSFQQLEAFDHLDVILNTRLGGLGEVSRCAQNKTSATQDTTTTIK